MPIIAIEQDHWEQIMTVQAEAYNRIVPESLATLKSKWLHSPRTCFAFEQNSQILAYLLAHAWDSLEPPKLYSALPQSVAGDILFLHDLAVLREHKNKRIGRQLVAHLLALAPTLGFRESLLVAVQGSAPFWANFGFTSQEQTPANEIYGTGAIVMVKTLNK